MKILNLEQNDFGQIIATVLNCGKELRIFANTIQGLPKEIVKSCKFTTLDDVSMDLELNYHEECVSYDQT